MRTSLRSWGILLFFVAVTFFAQWRVMASFVWRYPAANELVPTENLAGDVGALLLGSHRLGADIAYIQFLQYYGVPESESVENKHNDGHEDEHGVHDHFGGGFYPQLKTLATRYMRIDPFFNRAVIEAAGALAFNVKRTDEALDFLKEAFERDPSYFRYQLYVAAILFKEKGEEAKLIEKLEEAIRYPDCPPLLQGILGNLLKKNGRFLDAGRVYLYTYQTTPDPAEQNVARERLLRLVAEHPELIKPLGLTDLR